MFQHSVKQINKINFLSTLTKRFFKFNITSMNAVQLLAKAQLQNRSISLQKQNCFEKIDLSVLEHGCLQSVVITFSFGLVKLHAEENDCYEAGTEDYTTNERSSVKVLTMRVVIAGVCSGVSRVLCCGRRGLGGRAICWIWF